MLYSRGATLEEIFKKPAGDWEETQRRQELLMYESGLQSEIDAQTLLVNSKRSRNGWGHWIRSRRLCDFLITLKTKMKSTGFSKIYKRLSATIWFVRGLDTLPDVD